MSENIVARLLSANAKVEADKIAFECLGSKKLLDQLILLFCSESYRITQRISWILVLLAEMAPEKLIPYENMLIESLQKDDVPDAVKRNVMRIWSITGISEKAEGLVYDICIKYLMAYEAIAIKVHAMTVATKIAKPWVELRQELKIIVEDILAREGNSAGIRSKCTRVLKEL